MRAVATIAGITLVLVGCDSPGPICAQDADCLGGRVCGFWPQELMDGAPLSLSCVSPSESGPSPCAEPGDCPSGICLLGGECGRPCVVDDSCASAMRCRDVLARTVPGALHPLRACAPEAAVADGVDVNVQRRAASLDAFSTVILPGTTSGATSYAVVPLERRYPPLSLAGGYRLITGSVDGLDPLGGGESLLEPEVGRSLGILRRAPVPTFLVPFGYEAAHSERGYLMELSGFGSWAGEYVPTEADVVRFHRETEGSILDVDVFLLGERVAPWSRRLESVWEDVDTIFAQARISIGDVRIHPVLGRTIEPFESLATGGFGQSSTLKGDLFELSAGLARPSVPVFVLSTALFRDFNEIGGCSGGIAGPQGIHGSEGSGVVISFFAVGRGLDQVLAHEIGHFLGLFHTTERSGTAFDAHADTPECDAERDLDGDGEVSWAECAAAGADNLMFWGGLGTTLTESQAQVIRSSPLLH